MGTGYNKYMYPGTLYTGTWYLYGTWYSIYSIFNNIFLQNLNTVSKYTVLNHYRYPYAAINKLLRADGEYGCCDFFHISEEGGFRFWHINYTRLDSWDM